MLYKENNYSDGIILNEIAYRKCRPTLQTQKGNSNPFKILATQIKLSVIGGLDYWNGLLEWTLTPPQELTIYIEELVLAHAGLACKVVLARAVPRDSTRVLDFIIEMKPRHALLRGTILYLTTLSSQHCRYQ